MASSAQQERTRERNSTGTSRALLTTVFRDAGRYTRQLSLFRPVPRVNLTPLEALIAASLRPLAGRQQAPAGSSGGASKEELLAEHPKPEQPPVASLQSLATAVVGLHVDLYVSACADIVSLMPGLVKLHLLTIARRRRLLNDEVLTALIDSSWTHLDVSRSADRLSGPALAQAVAVPRLLALDLSACDKISIADMLAIAAAAPHLQLLRVGGSPQADEVAEQALPLILPQPPAVAAPDTWEDLAEATGGDEQETAGPHQQVAQHPPSHPGPPAASPRLQQLRFLVWPAIPAALAEHIHTTCPAVLVNPDPHYPFGRQELNVAEWLWPVAAALHTPIPGSAAAGAAKQNPSITDPPLGSKSYNRRHLSVIRVPSPSPLDPCIPLDETDAWAVAPAAWQQDSESGHDSRRCAPGETLTSYTAAEQVKLRNLAAGQDGHSSIGHRQQGTVSPHQQHRRWKPGVVGDHPVVSPGSEPDSDLPLAERFLAACAEAEVKRREREGLRAEREWRRAVRRSPAVASMEGWLDEM